MAVNLSPYGGVGAQFLDNSGNVLTGGKIYTYAAGTTTNQTTYTSATGTTPHSNPIILDAAGRVPSGEIWLTDGLQYKFVLKDSNDVLIATYDNIIGINSNFVNYAVQEEIQTATAGQTVFTLTTINYTPGTNSLSVFVDGVNQYDGISYAYVETNSTTVTFTSGLHVGALVKFTTAVTLSSSVTTAALTTFTGFKGQTGNVQDLADADGSDWIGFEPSGTGAVARSVEDKLRESTSLEDFGASSTSTSLQNATAFINAVQSGKRIVSPQQAYTFQFDGTPIIYTGTTLDIDLGPFKHTFLNFGGIVGNSVEVLRYNGRFGANNGYCKGLLQALNLVSANIQTIEITDVYLDNPAAQDQFWVLEYSRGSVGATDHRVTISVENAIFKNILTETVPFSSGNAAGYTGFGNVVSSSLQTEPHLLQFSNLLVENVFCVASDGVTVIDGDGDFFRFFTNPTYLSIDNCIVKNCGKRFVKTQEQAEVVIQNLYASLDSRFTTGNFISLFEGQAVTQTAKPSRFTILHGEVDFSASPSVAPGPVFFNGSTLDHEMYVKDFKYDNISVFSANRNIVFDAENINGTKLEVNAQNSTRISLNKWKESNLTRLVCSEVLVDNFDVSFTLNNTSFPISNAVLKNGVFNGMNVDTRIAIVKQISNVSVNYTTGTVARRPFRPVTSGTILVEALNVTSIGPSTQTFESPGGAGTMIIRDYRSSTQTLAFFSTGTWNFVLDNCDDDTVTGAGAVSVVRATYV